MKTKYNTKFSALTLAINLEPEVYMRDRLSKGWHPMKIYTELVRIAKDNDLPMVERRTIYLWIDKDKKLRKTA